MSMVKASRWLRALARQGNTEAAKCAHERSRSEASIGGTATTAHTPSWTAFGPGRDPCVSLTVARESATGYSIAEDLLVGWGSGGQPR